MQNQNKPVIVFEKQVMCDGATDNEAPSHPRVYLLIQKDNQIKCTYCGKVFIYDDSKN